MSPKIDEITERINQASGFVPSLFHELEQIIVGQKYLTERLVLGLLTGEHILLEGVPGLAKTTAVKTLAQSVKADFKRIQFTPDLLPADLLGTQVYQPKTGEFDIKKGPLFANIILADEINRAPAKVQSALLEAMGEQRYVADERYLDMATALSASGPAYVWLFLESLIDAGVYLGMARDLARTLVLQTVLGSTKLVEDSGRHPADLKDMVTSPGGTTVHACMPQTTWRAVRMRRGPMATPRSPSTGSSFHSMPGNRRPTEPNLFAAFVLAQIAGAHSVTPYASLMRMPNLRAHVSAVAC